MTGEDTTSGDNDLVGRNGRKELAVRQRYETLSMVNDIATGVLFVVGSLLFLSASTSSAGAWVFLVGSVSMLLRPVIQLTSRVELGRRGADRTGSHETPMDY